MPFSKALWPYGEKVNLSLLVIRCKNIQKSKAFYESLGLSFAKEQHGNGPEHFASEINGIIFELYPNAEKAAVDNSRLGFRVNELDSILTRVQVQSSYSYEGKAIYVVVDPDGRKVEISA